MTLWPQTECPACEGHGCEFSDNGPAPREYMCEVCEGTGMIDAEDGPEEELSVLAKVRKFTPVMDFQRSPCGFIHIGDGE